MNSRPEDYSPPPSAGPSGACRGPDGFPANSHFSSFFIDDILSGEGRLGRKAQTSRPYRPVPLHSSAISPLPSPPSSPVDPWPAPGPPSAVTPDALALDGGGVLADYRLLPPPFALFHQNVMTPSPHQNHLQHHNHPQPHQRHPLHRHHGVPESPHCQRQPHGVGAFVHFHPHSGATSYLDPYNDSSSKGVGCERWASLQCHMLALRQGRGLPHASPAAGAMLSLCSSKRKGGQVRFSPDQTTALERRFGGHKYLSPEERRILAQDLKLTDRQVKTWFQNRRAKWRRASQTSSPSSPVVSMDSRRAISLPETLAGGVIASRKSTTSSGKGDEAKGAESDFEDEVFQEEKTGSAG
ncbi:T-cell leukemia homeobox protein 3 [Ischnura elegans]|uniref:T-cell leukemia homeobox protein 3 n=1 Tax=Ischnura elegans TaxID=197161 RepID=UPI001ED867F4|nr:T-cell leukemia homeobox protein 3 [Ischnura elegans]